MAKNFMTYFISFLLFSFAAFAMHDDNDDYGFFSGCYYCRGARHSGHPIVATFESYLHHPKCFSCGSKEFFTEDIPNFFTKDIPNFFSGLSSICNPLPKKMD